MSGSTIEMRLNKMHQTLDKLFGIKLNLDIKNVNKLRSLLEEYTQLREKILHESNFNSYYQNPEYVKAILILEAINVFLSEIAPKRMQKKNKKKSGS
jgi:hypothetical protein